jgi:hypothetical protein
MEFDIYGNPVTATTPSGWKASDLTAEQFTPGTYNTGIFSNSWNTLTDLFKPQTYNTGGSLGNLPMPSKFSQFLSPVKTGFDLWSTWEGIKGAKLQQKAIKQQMRSNEQAMKLARAQAGEIYSGQEARRQANMGVGAAQAQLAGDAYSSGRMAKWGL